MQLRRSCLRECGNQKQVASHSQAVRAGGDHKSVALEFAATEFLLQQTLGVVDWSWRIRRGRRGQLDEGQE